jgi:hypothetical protein
MAIVLESWEQVVACLEGWILCTVKASILFGQSDAGCSKIVLNGKEAFGC